jgi:hypothetical protein
MTKRASAFAAAFALAAALAGCGEDTPRGDELSAPAQRDAAPLSPEAADATEAERREEQREAEDVAEPEPGDTGFDPE